MNLFRKILLFVAVLALPLGTRLFLKSFIPGFHEYEAVFLYASDFILLVLIFLAPWKKIFSGKNEAPLADAQGIRSFTPHPAGFIKSLTASSPS